MHIMKLLCLLAISWIPALASAQSSPNAPFLFQSFIEGKVYFKSGKTETSMLNYDTKAQTVLFSNNNQYWILDQLPLIDSITIGQRKFVPVDTKVYEEVGRSGDTLLLVTYRARTKPKASTVDHTGSNTQNAGAVSNTVSDYYLGRNYKANSSLEVIPSYWVLQGRKLFKVNTARQWKTIYPEGEDFISGFFKSNSLRASDPDDMALYVTLFRNLSH